MVSFIYPIRKECISLYVFFPAGFGKCRRSDGMDVFWFMGLDILTCGNLLDELFGMFMVVDSVSFVSEIKDFQRKEKAQEKKKSHCSG